MASRWTALSKLPERLEAERRRRFPTAKPWRPSAAEKRLIAWGESQRGHRRCTLSAHYAARVARVPVRWLMRATKGQPFRLDFGRNRDGLALTLFYSTDLVAWARARAAGRPAPWERPRTVRLHAVTAAA